MFLLNLRPIKIKKMTNTYETVFIMNPVLSEDQIKETVKKFVDYIKNSKGKITNEENWGLKKLKYLIQKKKTGFYYMIEFESTGEFIKNFEVEFKRDERVIRWQTIRLDKYALEYASSRKKRLNTKNK